MADGQNNIISDFRVGGRGGVSRRVGVVVAMRYHDRFGTQIGFRSGTNIRNSCSDEGIPICIYTSTIKIYSQP